MFKISVVLILCLASAFGEANDLLRQIYDDTRIQPAVTATCDVINRSGLTCRDCETLTRCVTMQEQWESYDVDKCNNTAGIFCNSIEGRCSPSTGPCNQAEFFCDEEGYFPSPYTCQEYFYCLDNGGRFTPIQRFCNPGFAYSVATTQCTLTIRDPICSALQWSCTSPGQIAGWPGSDELFYICQHNIERNELLPDIHRCLNNQIFDGLNCVNRS